MAGCAATRERVARYNFSACSGEKPQHLALAFGEGDAFVAAAEIAMRDIEAKLAEAHDRFLRKRDLPIFGPTQAALYWSSTEFDVTDAWNVNFSSPFFVVSALFKSNEFPVRAVRAGP